MLFTKTINLLRLVRCFNSAHLLINAINPQHEKPCIIYFPFQQHNIWVLGSLVLRKELVVEKIAEIAKIIILSFANAQNF